jgi:NAD(P)-dependent dehydrogenase (short-subunit alcohol dehydrogenase family)
VLEQQAVKRPLTAEDQAAAVAFLVSADASAITGQSLRVDGGVVRCDRRTRPRGIAGCHGCDPGDELP